MWVPNVSARCIALLWLVIATTSGGDHASFIQSAHKYRDRDSHSSHPSAEPRDEIGQSLLFSNGTENIKTTQEENKTRLNFLNRRATGDVKDDPTADCSPPEAASLLLRVQKTS